MPDTEWALSKYRLCGLHFNLNKGTFLIFNGSSMFCLCPPHLPWLLQPVHYLLAFCCRPLGLLAWRFCHRCWVKSEMQEVAPNHQSMGAELVAQLLSLTVETSLGPALCRLPEVSANRRSIYSEHWLANVPLSTSFPTSLVHLLSVALFPALVLSLIWGNSNSVQL